MGNDRQATLIKEQETSGVAGRPGKPARVVLREKEAGFERAACDGGLEIARDIRRRVQRKDEDIGAGVRNGSLRRHLRFGLNSGLRKAELLLQESNIFHDDLLVRPGYGRRSTETL